MMVYNLHSELAPFVRKYYTKAFRSIPSKGKATS